MTMPKFLDVVLLKHDLPEHGLRQGAVGTVVEVYDNGEGEVEFANDDGETLGLATLLPDQLDILWSGEPTEQGQTVQQLVAIVNGLQPEQAREVLDFARFLRTRAPA